ncbi:MAG: tRNA pseudouridine(13) synthase TruD [Candidatus Hydrothermarchaeota archaeon]|nr:tRNA pseudouridine(13) synthase TruD [Candidatus Hydrothermarchaeota archaeon]
MKSPYKLDQLIGLEQFVTSSRGIGGKLRTKIDDFFVAEVYNVENPGWEYTYFTLEKKNWNTIDAIKALARSLGVSHKRFGYAGTKDKRALTRQRVAAWKIEAEQLQRVRIEGIALSDFKKCSERISLGDSLGNRFRIAIRNIDFKEKELNEILSETAKQLGERGIPNYFGYQRFGIIRPNTHIVGREIVRGNLEGAAMAYLANPFEAEKKDAYEARKLVQETKDFKKALEIFPMRLNFERSMLDALAKNPRDYAGALRRLPKKLRLMLVHGYQSYLFNKILSRMIGEEMSIKGKKIPLFGYESCFSEDMQGEIEKEIIEENIALENFKIKSMPELSSEGLLRDACIETSPDFEIDEDEINEGKLKCIVSFDLPRGSYATVVLREFMKTEPMSY